MMPARITPHLKSIRCPAELRVLKAWLLWRYEANGNNPSAKPRKVPYYADGGRRSGVQGSPEDVAQMVTFDAAVAAAAKRGMTGVGIALLPGLGITVLDLDGCMTDAGIHPEAAVLCEDTYAEFSPSGGGAHSFYAGSLGDRKDSGGQPFGLESFTEKGYVTFTGNALPGVEDLELTGRSLRPVPEAVTAYCNQRFAAARSAGSSTPDDSDPLDSYSPTLGLSIEQIREALGYVPGDLTYDEWIAVGMGVHHETDGSDEGFVLWDEWSSRSAKYTTSEYGRERWDSFGKRSGRQTTARFLLKVAKAGGLVTVRVARQEMFEESRTDEPTRKRVRFQPVPAGTFSSGQDPAWLVDGLLPERGVGVLYGESGAGKTFMALDIAGCVVRGVPWRGAPVSQGRVVYVAAEGQGGLRKRLRAYAAKHDLDLDAVPLEVIEDIPQLMTPSDAVALAKAIGPARLIVIDTLAASMAGGNENAGEDVGRLLAHCVAISRATGALVLLVHHAGKDLSKGSRGWSGIKAGADVELEVSRVGAVRQLRIEKMRDGDDSAGPWAFDLEPLAVGVDARGATVTSCVVLAVDSPAPRVRAVRARGKLEVLACEVLDELYLVQGAQIPLEEALETLVERMEPPEKAARDTRRQRARRALEAVCDLGDSPYWLTDGVVEVKR